MKTIWKNYKLLIISIGYIVAISAFLYFVFFPFIHRIKQKSDFIEEKRLDSQITKLKLEKIPQMKNDFAIFQKDKDAVDAVIERQNIISFIKKLESLAADTGNKIAITVDESGSSGNNKNPKISKNKEKTIADDLSHTNFVLLNINLNGKYENLVNFMNKLENNNHYVNIVFLDLEKKIEGKDNAQSNSGTLGSVFTPRSVPKESKDDKEAEILNSNLGLVMYLKN